MSSFFRLIAPHSDFVVEGDTIEYLKHILGSLKPGHYQVAEILSQPLPSGRTVRRRGRLWRLPDGRIVEQPQPREP
jgi:hypothetical protein